MEAGAHGIPVWVKEDEDALAAPGNHEEQPGEPGQSGDDADEKILPLHAGEDEHHGGDAGQHHGCAEIGLPDNEQNENHGHNDGAQQSVLPVAHGVKAGGEKPGEKKNEDQLGDFRGLKGEVAAEADPAMRVVGAGDEENEHKQQRGDAERGIDEARASCRRCRECA